MARITRVQQMKHLNLILAAAILLSTGSQAAQAQNYHKNYGGSRVVNQNQTGLHYSDSSYINCGTLSRSAQGKQAGMTNNGLPGTTWGGYIRSPGDGIYNGMDGTMRMENGAVVYRDELVRAQMANQMRQQQQMMQYRQRQMQQQYPQQQGNFYVPGSNGGAASYSTGVAGYGSYGR